METMNGEDGSLDECGLGGAGGGGEQFLSDKFSCQASKNMELLEEASEIIWSNPLIFQKPRDLGTVPHEI